MAFDYTLTALGLATRAYRRLGILPAGGAPTDDQFQQFLDVYNMWIVGMQAEGPNLFRLTQVQLDIPANIGYAFNPYIITPQVMAVLACRVVVTPAPNLYERPLGPVSYGDYMNYPNKQTAQGTPTTYCFDKQGAQSNLYIYPLAANGCIVNATVDRFGSSISDPNDTLDIPQEWWQGLSYAMADLLMEDEGVAAADEVTAQRITQRAVAFMQVLSNWDRPTSIFIRPYGKAGQSRVWRG